MKKILMMFVAVACCVVLAAETTPTKRVLFIGNSYTFFNNLPDAVAALGTRDGETWQVGRYLRGGATFGTHVYCYLDVPTAVFLQSIADRTDAKR